MGSFGSSRESTTGMDPLFKSLSRAPILNTIMPNSARYLPMIDEKQLPEFVETSLICVLSAAVAALGFLVVWLICILTGLGGP